MRADLLLQVGVDVPAASVMVVWDADRFGLAQLHQFRGRVGRGTRSSTCFLVTRSGPQAMERLSIMERSHDGFEIAEVDLEHRCEPPPQPTWGTLLIVHASWNAEG